MEQFKDFAAKVMGMADDEIAALYDADGNITEEAWKELAKKDKDRIKRIKEEHKEELTTKFNEGHAKAKREERGKYEDEIRENFGVDSKATGVDLIKDVVSKGQSGDVKTHPDYLALEKKLQSDYIPKEDFDVVKGEYDTFKQQVEKDKVFGRVKSDGRKLFYDLNPKLSENKTRAMNQESDFLAKLEKYNYQLDKDGNHVVLDSEGKRLVNDNMNPITFPELVKNLTLAHFDVMEQKPRGNSGVDDTGAGSTGLSFKDEQEFFKALANEGNPEKASKIYEQGKQQGFV